MRLTARAIPAAILVLAIGVGVWWKSTQASHAPTAGGETNAVSSSDPSGAGARGPAVTYTASPPPPPHDDQVKTLAFGSGPNDLGRGTSHEGRNVAPASFIAGADGLFILDQEKSRILRPDGTSLPLPGKHADDIARTKSGFAVLDREDTKQVTVVDGNGRVVGRLPLAGTGIEDPRDVSRMFVSGDDVYVERNGGGPLLLLGGADGTPAAERKEIQGVPTRDGSSLVSAGITSEDDGRAWVTLADRQAVHRWTRELKFGAALSAVGFLDSDANGKIWVVLLAGSSPADYVDWAVCLDGATGNVRGNFTLTAENPPWESFRDFAVQDGVGLVAARRTETGVSYTTYACP